MLKIQLSKQAAKFIQEVPAKQQKQLSLKILALQQKGHSGESKQLRGSNYYCLRVGEFRVIYDIEEQVLNILLIGKRNDGDIYKKFQRLLLEILF